MRPGRQPQSAADGDDESSETIDAEHDAGIHGQAWDIEADVPLGVAQASLWQDDQLIGAHTVAGDGSFVFGARPDRLLPPGAYQVTVDAPGFLPGSRPVNASDEEAVYMIGRVDLRRDSAQPDS